MRQHPIKRMAEAKGNLLSALMVLALINWRVLDIERRFNG